MKIILYLILYCGILDLQNQEVYLPVEHNHTARIEKIYRTDKGYFMNFSKGELQQAFFKKIKHENIEYYELKNLSYMINLKYYSKDFLSLRALFRFLPSKKMIEIIYLFKNKRYKCYYKKTYEADILKIQ